MSPMTDWRYWITYTGKIQTASEDEDVAKMEAMQHHHDQLQDPAYFTFTDLEVEIEGGKEG